MSEVRSGENVASLTDAQRLIEYDSLALWLLHDVDFVEQFPDSARTMERLLNSNESKAKS